MWNRNDRKVRSENAKILIDSNIIIDYAQSEKPNSVINKVYVYLNENDEPLVVKYVYEEVKNFEHAKRNNGTNGRKKVTEADLEKAVLDIVNRIHFIVNAESEQYTKYVRHKDVDDRPIVYYANELGVDIIITRDKKFRNVPDLNARVMLPEDYLKEGSKGNTNLNKGRIEKL